MVIIFSSYLSPFSHQGRKLEGFLSFPCSLAPLLSCIQRGCRDPVMLGPATISLPQKSFVVKITSEMKGKLLSFSKSFEMSHTKSLWQSLDEHDMMFSEIPASVCDKICTEQTHILPVRHYSPEQDIWLARDKNDTSN